MYECSNCIEQKEDVAAEPMDAQEQGENKPEAGITAPVDGEETK